MDFASDILHRASLPFLTLSYNLTLCIILYNVSINTSGYYVPCYTLPRHYGQYIDNGDTWYARCTVYIAMVVNVLTCKGTVYFIGVHARMPLTKQKASAFYCVGSCKR